MDIDVKPAYSVLENTRSEWLALSTWAVHGPGGALCFNDRERAEFACAMMNRGFRHGQKQIQGEPAVLLMRVQGANSHLCGWQIEIA